MDIKILEKVKTYVRLIAGRYPLKTAVVFGSQAKDTARPDSDIDIAIIFKEPPEHVLDVWASLFQLTREIDTAIEPKLVLDEKKSVFFDSIKAHAIKIYDNGSFIS